GTVVSAGSMSCSRGAASARPSSTSCGPTCAYDRVQRGPASNAWSGGAGPHGGHWFSIGDGGPVTENRWGMSDAAVVATAIAAAAGATAARPFPLYAGALITVAALARRSSLLLCAGALLLA